MLEPHERWDVVVVGAEQPALVELAAKLARYSGLPSREIQYALLAGEVRIHTGVRREEADAATQVLHELGANVEVRLSDANPPQPRRAGTNPATPASALPQLEPDPESPSAAAGLAAPPPIAGHAAVAAKPATGAQMDSSRVQGRPARPFERPFEREGASRRIPLARSGGSRPDRAAVDPNRVTAKEGELDEIAMRVAQGLSAARRARPDPNIPKSSAAAGEIGGSQRPVLPRSLHPPPAAASPPIGPAAPAASQPEPRLELDLDAVRFGAVAASAQAAQAKLDAASARSAPAATPAASPYAPDAAAASTRGAEPVRTRRLLGRDPITAMILGFVFAMAAGIAVAFFVTRSMIDEDVRPLETELEAAQAGASADRSADEIEAQLDETLASIRLRFFVAWAATAVPLGLLLGRMRMSG